MMIRPGQIEDAEKLLTMLHQLDRESETMLYEPGERTMLVSDLENYIRQINDSGSLYLIAEVDGIPVGFLEAVRGAASRIQHSAYIATGILKDYRGRKIGTQFFEKLDEWAHSESITRLELTVMVHNEGAVHLYQKMGFLVEGIRVNSMRVNGKYVSEYYMGKILE